ncbi:leucine-rich repeat domain-containing protein [Mycoplasma miroungirhinis]|uniref:Leucine-rich repeat protein n=1 Tax=Mycoplasma miroungirhinis TaxID=754516 RepID=A0A6M4JDQ8_9MOLU|nr:leucine-rich repeat domain-containing protein [Mycoplasma miroungirhinis]QJR44378.1 leucine-rich repeat protein [Mycoplasma miroungirhinis]
MKKSKKLLTITSLGLLSIAGIATVATSCATESPKKDEQSAQKPQTDNKTAEPQQKSAAQMKLDELENTILAAKKTKGPYSNDVDYVSTNIISEAITNAESSLHKYRTITNPKAEDIQKAIDELNKKMKEADDYFNLTTQQKQQILKDKYTQMIAKATELKNTLTKDDAKELIDSKLEEYSKLQETDSRYYRKIQNYIDELGFILEDAKKLNQLTDKQLYDAYIATESKILSQIVKKFGNDTNARELQEAIKEAFKTAKENTSEQYKEKEQNLKQKVNKLIQDADTKFITPEIATSLYNQETKQVQIPANVLTIKANSFENLEELENVTFNSKLKNIESHAFDKTNLTHITFPDTLETLSGFAQTPVTELTIPANTTEINYAFNNSSQLTTLHLNNKLTVLKGFDSTMVTELTLPETLQVFEGFRDTPITHLSLGSKINTFITSLPQLTELTFATNTNFDLVTNDIQSGHGIWISKSIFPKLEKIYVHSDADKQKLLKALGANIKISDDSQLEEQKTENNKKIQKRKLQFLTYLDYLGKISLASIKDLEHFEEAKKQKLTEFVNKYTSFEELKSDLEYIINHAAGYNARSTLQKLQENVAIQKELLGIVGYTITQEKLASDQNIEDEDVKTKFISFENKFNEQAKEYENLEQKNKDIDAKIAKNKEIVKQSEYYIQYLQDIYRNHKLDFNAISPENQTVVKEILNITDDMTIEQKNNAIDAFSFSNKYRSDNTLKMTEDMIKNYIKLITAFKYDLTYEHIKSDTTLDEETQTDYEIEKQKYENAKGNVWENIIQVKNS